MKVRNNRLFRPSAARAGIQAGFQLGGNDKKRHTT